MKRMGDLLGRIEELREQAKQRAEREKRDPLPGAPLPKNVVQLPLWPEPVRAVPNGFLRSALFGAIRKGRRRYLKAGVVLAKHRICVWCVRVLEHHDERRNVGLDRKSVV